MVSLDQKILSCLQTIINLRFHTNYRALAREARAVPVSALPCGPPILTLGRETHKLLVSDRRPSSTVLKSKQDLGTLALGWPNHFWAIMVGLNGL